MRLFSELPRHRPVWDRLVAEQRQVPGPPCTCLVSCAAWLYENRHPQGRRDMQTLRMVPRVHMKPTRGANTHMQSRGCRNQFRLCWVWPGVRGLDSVRGVERRSVRSWVRLPGVYVGGQVMKEQGPAIDGSTVKAMTYTGRLGAPS